MEKVFRQNLLVSLVGLEYRTLVRKKRKKRTENEVEDGSFTSRN